MKLPFLLCICFALFGSATAWAASPAEMISAFRLEHGEGRVTSDTTLTRIAHEQAAAMAAKDDLDHDVAGSFSRRISPAKAGRAAENIAYGYDNFPKTLSQWIDSPEHRKNLLMPDASRVGVASATSGASGRTYWAMTIAGDYESTKKVARTKSTSPTIAAKPKASASQASVLQSCHIKILRLCL